MLRTDIDNFRFRENGIEGKFDVSLLLPSTKYANPYIYSNIACFGYIIITLRLFLEKIDSTGTEDVLDADNYSFSSWPHHDWINFKDKVLELSKEWDFRFWLTMSEYYLTSSQYRNVEPRIAVFTDILPQTATKRQFQVHPPTFSCLFNLILEDSPGTAHKTIQCFYIKRENSNAPTVTTSTLRANDVAWHNGSISDKHTVMHELGHLLGLPHIGVSSGYSSCTKLQSPLSVIFNSSNYANAPECYRGSLASDVMGLGMEVNTVDSKPWGLALQTMTGIPVNYFYVSLTPTLSRYSETVEEGTDRWYSLHLDLW